MKKTLKATLKQSINIKSAIENKQGGSVRVCRTKLKRLYPLAEGIDWMDRLIWSLEFSNLGAAAEKAFVRLLLN